MSITLRATLSECKEVFNFSHHHVTCIAKLGPTSKTGGLCFLFKRYGLPTCFYLDKASQFTTTRHKGLHVQPDDTGQTQFERAMEELSVGLIFADSPQARGRGERINGSFQGRLVAELSFYAIKTREDAEKYLNNNFIPKYAQRFQVKPSGTVAFRQDRCSGLDPLER